MKIDGIHPFEFENKKISFVNAEKVVKELKYPIATIGPTKSLLEKLKAKLAIVSDKLPFCINMNVAFLKHVQLYN